MIDQHFTDVDFRRALRTALSAAHRDAADFGEVMATATRIVDGDADSWLREWTAAGGAAWSAARAAAAGGRRVSARGHYRRAASYYAMALELIERSSELDRHLDLWRRQRTCWERAIDLLPVPAERVRLPYGGDTLPGYFFRAPDAAPGEPRPLVVIDHGGGPTSQAWEAGGAAAGERGYHWMTFDGPGRQAAWFEQGLPSRHDWEAVLTPVVDVMTARVDVDARRLAAIGVGQAGFAVPRALAFEHRFAAAVVDPGLVDVSAPWTAALPASACERLQRRDPDGFERELHIAELFAPDTTRHLALRGAPFGANGGSRYGLFEAIARHRLGDEVAQIRTPLLIFDAAEGDWPGQARALYDRLPGVRRFMPSSGDDGMTARDGRIFDWLDGFLA